ncbi:MAG: DUF799 domain-containing protein [Succinivibrio sp.]
MNRLISLAFLLASVVFLNACHSSKITTMDYGPLIESDPKSILVMMPVSNSNDIKAGPAVLSSTVIPLSEKGYYVFPVTVVNDTFNHNGVTTSEQMREVPLAKLKEIYGADAVLYIDVLRYDTVYEVIDSVATVHVKAHLVDTNTGTSLWGPYDLSVNNEDRDSSSNIFAKLITTVVKHVVNNVSDVGYDLSRNNAYQLYSSNLYLKKNKQHISLLNGKRSPQYRKDPDYQLYMKQKGSN